MYFGLQIFKYCFIRTIHIVMQSIHSKYSNLREDGVNNIDPPATHLFQGVPTNRIIANTKSNKTNGKLTS